MYSESYPTLTRCEYRIKPWKKALSLMLGFPLVMGSLFLAATSNFGSANVTGGVSSLFLAAAGIYMLAWTFRSRLIIDGTRIEVRTAFGERSADFHDIEGFRTISTRYGTDKRLQLKNGNGTITVSNDFETDGDFDAWMRRLPDLDSKDRESLLDEIKSRQDLGATPEERMGALATAKTIAIFATVVVVALAIVMGFADPLLRSLAAVLLAFAPVAVFMLLQRSPLLYTIFRRKADPRAELAWVLMVASFGFLLGIRGVHLVSIKPLLPFILLLAALYLAPIFLTKRDDAMVMNRTLPLIFFAALYGYGAVVDANASFDEANAAHYRATVTRKHEYHGRSTTYTLYLAPWGPFGETNRLNVTGGFYRHTEIGDQVCLDLHRGRLYAPWFTQVDCATQSGPISFQ